MTRNLSDIANELLVLHAQDGKAWAFEQLHRRFGARLLRHARALTGRVDAAEDVCQEAWIAIARGLRRLDDPSRFSAWAYRIATHKAADWTRRESRQKDLRKGDEKPPESAQAEAAETTSLQVALKRLSADHRAILRLHYVEQMSLAEIATAMSIPVGTVKSRLFHSRKQLESVLERNRS